MSSTDRDGFTRYLITHRDGSPVDQSAVFYVLKLTGNTAHSAASRAALSLYAEKIAPIMPRLAQDCRKMCADEALKAGEVPVQAAQPVYVASLDGEDFRSERTYPDAATAMLRAPHDLNVQPGGTYWIGYLAPLRIAGDVTMYMHDLVNTLDEQGHAVAPLAALLSIGNDAATEDERNRMRAAADARLEVLADMLAQVIKQWAAQYGVDLSDLWGVTGIEQCMRPVPA